MPPRSANSAAPNGRGRVSGRRVKTRTTPLSTRKHNPCKGFGRFFQGIAPLPRDERGCRTTLVCSARHRRQVSRQLALSAIGSDRRQKRTLLRGESGLLPSASQARTWPLHCMRVWHESAIQISCVPGLTATPPAGLHRPACPWRQATSTSDPPPLSVVESPVSGPAIGVAPRTGWSNQASYGARPSRDDRHHVLMTVRCWRNLYCRA